MPSGISIFFCPETKSSNVNEIEKERLLALADKVNVSEIREAFKAKAVHSKNNHGSCLDDTKLLCCQPVVLWPFFSFGIFPQRLG
jgi:hypothetical protein